MKRFVITAGMLGLFLCLPGLVKAQEAGVAVDSDTKTFPFDNGPDTIDVSSYPAVLQENYKVFSEKCSKCHTLARPINSPYALPEEWQAYVTKMRQKKRSGINEENAAKIIEFLTYDSSIRKKDNIEQKLKEKKEGKTDAAAPDQKPAGKTDGGSKDASPPPDAH